MRYTGPKNRVARREGMDLGLKTVGTKSHAKLLEKINVPPGQHGTRGRRKSSEHSKQLREKQKLRFTFGISETQLKSYFKKAINKPGNTGMYMAQYLEKRLDNLVYRLGFAPTRASARQLVSHKHIKINDKVLNVASYEVKVGDVLTFAKDKTQKIAAVEQSLAKKDYAVPAWLERKGTVGKLNNEPESELLEQQFNMRLVIEFYSR